MVEPILTHDANAVSRKEVPFGGLDDEKLCLGVKTPKNVNSWGGNKHFKPNFQNFQMTISLKVVM